MAPPLSPITNLNGSAIGAINNNSTKIEDEFDKVLYKDGSVNMDGPLDMDSNRIINLPRATSPSSPVTLEQFISEKKGDPGDPGLPGVGGNTFLTLASMKALNPVAYASAILADGTNPPVSYAYVAGNFTGQADDSSVVALSLVPLSTGALVRQSASSATFRATSTSTVRTVEAKLREVEKSIADYGTGTDWSALVDAALASIGTTAFVRLVTPPGFWTSNARDYSNWRNVTFVFRTGAFVNNGVNAIVLPERVEISQGSNFTGSGLISQKNKDETILASPPGGYVRYGNVSNGLKALSVVEGGHNNFALGVNALGAAKNVRSAIAIGNGAQQNMVGDATGARAMVTESEILSYFSTGDACVALGDFTLRDNLRGTECIAIGANALQQQTDGHCNIAIGANSQITGINTGYNVSVGGYCLVTNQGKNNVAIGWAALEGQTSGSNVAIGHASMNGNKTGTSNVAIGPLTLQKSTNGNNNLAAGQEALKNLTSGSGNTGLGAFAVGSAVSGTNTTAIGLNALVGMTEGVGNSALGAGALSVLVNYSNCTGLGTGAQVTGNDQLQLGNSAAVPYSWVSVQARSDARDKADVRNTVLGLDFVNKLRPVDYRLNFRVDYEGAPNDGSKKRTRFHHGLIAQEVAEVIAETGVDFGGFQDHKIKGGEDVLSIGYTELIAPMIKAIQELTARVAELESK